MSMEWPWLNVPRSVPRSVIRKLMASVDPDMNARAIPTEPINVERNSACVHRSPFPRRKVCRLLTVGSDT